MSAPAFDVPVEALVRTKSSEAQRRRWRRPREVRALTIGVRRVSRAMLDADRVLFPERPGVDYERPKTRAECADGPRPCPFVSCRFHLYLDVNRAGGLKLNFPDLEVEDLTESCALDVADRGGVTLETLRPILNLTRQAVQLIEKRALDRLVASSAAIVKEARSWLR